MKKTLLYVLLLMVGLGLLFACNKQKPVKLDYTHKQELYDPQGLPGEGYVGSPPEDQKHTKSERGALPQKDEKEEGNKQKKKEKGN